MRNNNDFASVTPKERINIKYVPATNGQRAEIELPLTLMVIGDLKGRTEETPIEERQTVSLDKNNFNSVMRESKIDLAFNVPNCLEEESEDDLPVHLNIASLADLSPDNLAQQVPELRKLLELRSRGRWGISRHSVTVCKIYLPVLMPVNNCSKSWISLSQKNNATTVREQ